MGGFPSVTRPGLFVCLFVCLWEGYDGGKVATCQGKVNGASDS